MCIPLGGTKTLPQGCTVVAASKSPPLISSGLNLPFGTRELKLVPYKQDMGDAEPHRGLFGSLASSAWERFESSPP